jgi:hypothetical protein
VIHHQRVLDKVFIYSEKKISIHTLLPETRLNGTEAIFMQPIDYMIYTPLGHVKFALLALSKENVSQTFSSSSYQ